VRQNDLASGGTPWHGSLFGLEGFTYAELIGIPTSLQHCVHETHIVVLWEVASRARVACILSEITHQKWTRFNMQGQWDRMHRSSTTPTGDSVVILGVDI